MFKKIVTASLAAATMSASAYAADLRAPPPYVPPPPVYTWTGAYIGLNAGGVFEQNNNDANGLFAVPGGCASGAGCIGAPGIAPLGTGRALATAINLAGNGLNNTNNRGGFLGGGQIGINWQWNQSFVFGAELDAQGVWTNRNDNGNFGIATVGVPGFPGATSTAVVGFTHRLDSLGTARLRAGFLATPAFLIYATGGAAAGGIHSTGFVAAIPRGDATVIGGLPLNVNGSNTRVGWTGGGGIEWMFLPNWSLKGEALYYDLGRFHSQFGAATVIGSTTHALIGSALTVATFRERGVIARAGINYHFFSAPVAPVVARY